MKKYKIVIEEILVGEFEVKAADSKQALDIAREKYRKGEFVLSPGEVHHKQITVTYPPNESVEWEEF